MKVVSFRSTLTPLDSISWKMALISKANFMGSLSFNSRLNSFTNNYIISSFEWESQRLFNFVNTENALVLERICRLTSSVMEVEIKAYDFLSLLFQIASCLSYVGIYGSLSSLPSLSTLPSQTSSHKSLKIKVFFKFSKTILGSFLFQKALLPQLISVNAS